MPDLLLTDHAPDAAGLVHRVTPQSAGWTYVGFDTYRLQPGQRVAAETGDLEACLVILGGKATIAAGGETYAAIGERADVFSGRPWSVYVPWKTGYGIEAVTACEVAVCTAPGGGDHAPRLIRPEDCGTMTRGSGTNTRHVCDILPETKPAHSLLVVEVITPSGCWSSYPSHKHDTDNFPDETRLEEIYFHKLNPPQGFAFQRVYTDDKALDVTMCIHDGDLVMVPYGYHPCGTAHGYDLYYLNVMAGPKRMWRVNTRACHRWLLPK